MPACVTSVDFSGKIALNKCWFCQAVVKEVAMNEEWLAVKICNKPAVWLRAVGCIRVVRVIELVGVSLCASAVWRSGNDVTAGLSMINPLKTKRKLF
jgi:hypothetical protein